MESQHYIKPIDKRDLVSDLETLGVRQGDLLNLKVSMNSIGYVVGGAKTLIDAILEVVGSKGTIITDSFVDVYPLPLNKRDAQKVSDRFTPSYAGALANTMLYHPDAVCSAHPVQRFVAIGAHAKELMANHTPESYAYDVLRVMAQSMGGRNLKLGTDEKVVGVGTTHVAIGLLKLHQNRPRVGVNYYDYKTGQIRLFERNWSGACDKGLINFIPLYRKMGAIIAEGKVGNADSKITDMKKTLEIEVETLSKNPSFFFCNDPSCEGCRLTWDFSTGSTLSFKYHSTIKLIRAGSKIAFQLLRNRTK
ncbi:MAG: AAC(3) family N-acetyltransferase [Dehalococcoidales bacterium]